MSWLNELLRQHSDMESPLSFWMWSGLVSISAVVKDNVWLPRGGNKYNLYPNIYCILHAHSGLKKGPPIALAKELVSKVNNTKIISGRSSIQGILKEMSIAQTLPGGHVRKGSTAFISSSELSASIVQDPAALTLLTDLYDRNYNKDDWSSLLKMEKFDLVKPTVTLFGGINNAHAEEFFQDKDIKGGFFARTFVVYETKRANINSLAKRGVPVDIDNLVKYLRILGQLKGPFKELVDDKNELTEVGEYYDTWYQSFEATVEKEQIQDETGTLNRFGDSVLKIAILLSLSRKPELEIDLESLKDAISIGEKLIGNIRKTTQERAKKDTGNNATRKALIIQELVAREGYQISREKFLKKFWQQGNADEWDACVNTLAQAGAVIIENPGGEVYWRMINEYGTKLKAFLEGKNK